MTVRICPSVLNADQNNLAQEIERVKEVADFIHLDIMDDKFVPNFTYSFERTQEIVKQSLLPIDLHLMVNEADYWGPAYATLKSDGVFSVTVHFEATKDLPKTISLIKAEGVRCGVAIKPATPVEVVKEILDKVDMVLVMTVEPGFGGQSFMSEMMSKVQTLRSWIDDKDVAHTWLQVDGGIALATIDEASASGADTFVAGSAVYKSENPAGIVEELRKRALASRR